MVVRRANINGKREREKKKNEWGCYEGKGEISYAHETLPVTLCEQLGMFIDQGPSYVTSFH